MTTDPTDKNQVDYVLTNLFEKFKEYSENEEEFTKADIDKLTGLAKEIRNYVKYKYESEEELKKRVEVAESQYANLKNLLFNNICDDCFNNIVEILENEE